MFGLTFSSLRQRFGLARSKTTGSLNAAGSLPLSCLTLAAASPAAAADESTEKGTSSNISRGSGSADLGLALRLKFNAVELGYVLQRQNEAVTSLRRK